jgi:hypothetical protein
VHRSLGCQSRLAGGAASLSACRFAEPIRPTWSCRAEGAALPAGDQGIEQTRTVLLSDRWPGQITGHQRPHRSDRNRVPGSPVGAAVGDKPTQMI